MKRTYSGWLFCMLIAALGVGCESDSGGKLGDGHDFGDNNPEVVLVMGDSISAGGYSGGPPWPSRFADMVGKTVVNYGVPGANSIDGAGRISRAINSIKPGYVIIWYGANDAIQSISVDSTDRAINYMVDVAKTNKVIPVVINVMPMAGGRSIFNGTVDRINERIKSIKAKKVNAHKLVNSDPFLYLEDGLHLSDTGENAIALEVLDVF